jgi:predicted ester cyclase
MTPEEVVRAWNNAYARTDLEKAKEYLSEDFVRLGDWSNWEPVGKDRWAAGQIGFFVAFPDWTWDLEHLTASGDTVVGEFVERGTFTKPFETIAGLTLEPNGKSYLDRDCLCFRVNEDGLIAELRAYITNNLDRTFHFEAQLSEYLANLSKSSDTEPKD